MTITREWEFCGDVDNTNSHALLFDTTQNCSMSTVQAFTGTYAFAVPVESNNATPYHGTVNLSASRQKRAAFRIYNTDWQGTGGPPGPTLFSFRSAGAELVSLRVTHPTALHLYMGGVLAATYNCMVTGWWQHIGVDVKIDASAGWATIYWDGAKVLEVTGNTGAADIVTASFGAPVRSYGNNYYGIRYYSDMYIDDTAGEAAAAVVPGLRFYKKAFDNNGDLHEWIPSTGVDNFAMVDEVPNDGSTTYNATGTDAKTDLFTHTAHVTPAAETLKAVMPYVIVQNVDPGVACKIAGCARNGADTDQVGTFVALASSYRFRRSRLTTLPDANPLSDAGINDCQYGYKSQVP